MTEKLYLITEAQLDAIVTAFSTLTVTMSNEPHTDKLIGRLQNHAEIKKQLETLQSLPMVDSQPICHLRIRTASTHWNSFEPVPRDMDNAFPVYTSPQALTKISADDVTDEMVLDYFTGTPFEKLQLHPSELYQAKQDISAGYNAVIKHRSEA